MTKNVDRYGADYHLAVFAERRWAGEDITHQRFATGIDYGDRRDGGLVD
jgi:hypothetical protein